MIQEKKLTAEEMLDEMEAGLRIIEKKLDEKLNSKKQNPEDIKKNSHLHIFLETSLHEKIKKEAEEKNIGISELVRQKLRGNEQLDRIEGKIDKLLNP